MEYTFEIKEIPAATLLTEKATCGHGEIGAKLAEILPHVGRRAGHFLMAGPPMCLYHDWREADCDIEAGVPIAGEPDLFGDIHVTHLPAHKAVTVVHVGYDTLSEAHEAVMHYLKENGMQPSGSPWESYIDDPGETGMDKARTLVGWPIG